MRFAGTQSSAKLFTLAAALGMGTSAWASELCPPTAILSGPSPLVQELTRALVERGVRVEPAGLPPGECAPLAVELTATDGLFGVSIADAWGRTAERTVKDPATAATLIESWARMDLLDGATTTSSRSATAAVLPPLKNAPVETPTQKIEPTTLRAAAAPAAPLPEKTSLFRLSAEGGVGRDGLRWVGVSGSACARLGPVCLGMGARYGLSQARQNAVDGLALLDVPLVFGRFSLTPGVGIGVGWLSAHEHGGFGSFGSDHNEGLAARAEVHLMASFRLSERLSIQLGTSATHAPSFGHHQEFMGDPHLAVIRGQAGLVWGIP